MSRQRHRVDNSPGVGLTALKGQPVGQSDHTGAEHRAGRLGQIPGFALWLLGSTEPLDGCLAARVATEHWSWVKR